MATVSLTKEASRLLEGVMSRVLVNTRGPNVDEWWYDPQLGGKLLMDKAVAIQLAASNIVLEPDENNQMKLVMCLLVSLVRVMWEINKDALSAMEYESRVPNIASDIKKAIALYEECFHISAAAIASHYKRSASFEPLLQSPEQISAVFGAASTAK